MAGVQFGQGLGQQRGGQGSPLAHMANLPGLTTQTRRRGRPRKATTGATTTSGRSHKKRT
jgi:hypothetical protein